MKSSFTLIPSHPTSSSPLPISLPLSLSSPCLTPHRWLLSISYLPLLLVDQGGENGSTYILLFSFFFSLKVWTKRQGLTSGRTFISSSLILLFNMMLLRVIFSPGRLMRRTHGNHWRNTLFTCCQEEKRGKNKQVSVGNLWAEPSFFLFFFL